MQNNSDIIISNQLLSGYSNDTEVMTDAGWKLIKDINVGNDLVMSLNHENGCIEMVNVFDSVSNQVNNELYHFYNRNMDFCVTKNQEMYRYSCQERISKTLSFIKANCIRKSHLLPLVNFSWKEGMHTEYFYLPSTKQLQQYSRKEIQVPMKKIRMDDWLEFFGFYLADGCYRDHINSCGKRDYTISIAQNKVNEEYVLDLIKRIGFTCRISPKGNDRKANNYCIYSKQLWEYLSQFGRSQDKYIPRSYMNLERNQLAVLLKGYMNGDSSRTQNCIRFSSVSKKLIDNIQELLLKVHGFVTQVRKRKMKHSYDNGECIFYYISVKLDRHHMNFSKYGIPEKIAYNDCVYNLVLDSNQIMLTRHNNIIGWGCSYFLK